MNWSELADYRSEPKHQLILDLGKRLPSSMALLEDLLTARFPLVRPRILVPLGSVRRDRVGQLFCASEASRTYTVLRQVGEESLD